MILKCVWCEREIKDVQTCRVGEFHMHEYCYGLFGEAIYSAEDVFQLVPVVAGTDEVEDDNGTD